MRSPILMFLVFLPFLLSGQAMDEEPENPEIDSLLRVVQTRIDSQAYDQALDINRILEDRVIGAFGMSSVHLARVFISRGRILRSRNELDDAESCFQKALSILDTLRMTGGLDYADGLSGLGSITIDRGQYDQTERYLARAIEIRRFVSGNLDPDLAKDLSKLGYACYQQVQYEKAEKYTLESLAIQKHVYGEKNMTYIANLVNLALLYNNMRLYAKAEPLFLQAKSYFEEQGLDNSPNYAWLLTRLGNVYKDMNDFSQSEPCLIQAKDIMISIHGEFHPGTAMQMTQLAQLYRVMGKYEQAETLTLRAMEIQAQTLGEDNPQYAETMHALGIIYSETGQYDKAEPLYKRSLNIARASSGRESILYGSILNNMAILSWQMGDFAQSEQLYLDLISLNGQLYGYESIKMATTYYNLAIVYSSILNLQKAEELYVRATDIQKTILGETHSDYATGLVGLTGLYYQMNDFKRAEACIRKAMDIREHIYGRKHYMYATCLDLLAHVLAATQDYTQAEAMYQEAIGTYREVLGEEHPLLATALRGLGDLYLSVRDYQKADTQFRQAMDIYMNSLEPNHISLVGGWFDLGLSSEHLGHWTMSDSCMRASMEIARTQLAKGMGYLSGQELSEYVAGAKNQMETISSCLATRQANDQSAGDLAALDYDLMLFFKGFILTSARQIQQLARSTPQTASMFEELNGCRRFLARELAKPADQRKRVAEFESRANDLEKELSRSLAGYAENGRQVNWKDVQTALGPEEAAIEFIHYRQNFPEDKDTMHHAALVLRPGMNQPVFVPLCREDELKVLLHVSRDRGPDFVSRLYSLSTRGLVNDDAPLHSLQELLWAPLQPLLEGVKTVYYAPSGILHQINLGAIGLTEEEVVADRYNLVMLGSTRQLVVPSKSAQQSTGGALFGDIRYDADTTAMLAANPIRTADHELASRGLQQAGNVWASPARESWSNLSSTAREVEDLYRILGTKGMAPELYTGFAATEEAFKALDRQDRPSPRVIHLATHGFFYTGEEETGPDQGSSALAFKSSDHPMIRSGLVMAGANHAWQTGLPIGPDREDGILTAYEISQMDLSGTELAVLSACETGLGDIGGQEGVYGLQRAFKIAGVRYLIMSLWNVRDRPTAQLMTAFYRYWLEEDRPIPEAFRQAQMDMKEMYLDPYYWAGFVLVE